MKAQLSAKMPGIVFMLLVASLLFVTLTAPLGALSRVQASAGLPDMLKPPSIGIATTTSLSASPTTLNTTNTTILTTIVTFPDGTPVGAHGQVIFYDGTTKIGSADLNSAGQAVVTYDPGFQTAIHPIKAVYSGFQDKADNITYGSTSPAVTVLVNNCSTCG